jgi:hypothetical protein
MKESLEKIIRRVILPKYDWIKNFRIYVDKYGERNLYNVRYYIDDDVFDKIYEVDDDGYTDKVNNIESDTKNLYNVLGPSQYDMLDGTGFRSHRDM